MNPRKLDDRGKMAMNEHERVEQFGANGE